MRGRAWVFGGVAGAAVFLGSGGAGALEDADGFVARARTHYANVEVELLAADVSALTPAQRTARHRAIASLRAYRERGDFGRNTDFPGGRVPYFVDDTGRRCAVAELLHTTGEDDVVARVARTSNHAWVADLAGDAELVTWLGRNGLTVEDAARIQGPSFAARFNQPQSNGGPNADGAPQESTEGKNGRDNAASAPDGGGPAPGSQSGPSAGVRGGRGGGGVDAGSWWLWWECNKLDFLAVQPLRLAQGAARDPGEDRSAAASLALDAARADAARVFTAALSDADAIVRGAAAVALGRVAGEAAVARLVPLLDDADRAVRERAILALGATGSAAGADVLIDIAGGDRSATSESRAIAVLALAIANRYGLERSFDAQIAGFVEDAKKRDLADLGSAALVHRVLVGGPELDERALRAALDANAPAPERARAVELLGTLLDKRAASALRNVVGDRRVDVRRSAAIALGDVRNPLSVAQMKTAYEFETEPLTRGLLLVSLGRAGGAPALEFLRSELAHGPEALRPWAALGLGLLARSADSVAARVALRGADLAADAQGAVSIARGLAGDTSAVPALVKALAEASSPPERADAATGLALLGTDEAHAALAAACATEKSEYARVVIAWGLGSMGRDEDSAAILATVDGIADADLVVVGAVALGFNGSRECVEGALRRASDRKVAAVARAAAIDAAGLLLSRSRGLVLHEVSRRTNFAVMPRWFRSALGVTL